MKLKFVKYCEDCMSQSVVQNFELIQLTLYILYKRHFAILDVSHYQVAFQYRDIGDDMVSVSEKLVSLYTKALAT